MQLDGHQKLLGGFYKIHNWYHDSPFIRLNFLTEEVGELSQAMRAIEIGRDHPGEKNKQEALVYNLKEELADVLEQVLISGSKFNIDPDVLLEQSENKLRQRCHQ
ncbi:MazG nucleotide pyrophosphohydrolase domain-containing protein [Loigolactobacillus binensis]|uniref:MazG nucleotide pyrophosphohydrolase domain-containing protein n=1 Tax=Loigolactobacillus binensis TaxID=2559922 RepID=A0ABW3E9X6_9LACO|nr:MazG-like family protein [Loigolactobacillus binensis]